MILLKKLNLLFVGLIVLYVINPYGTNIYTGYLVTVFILVQKGFLLKNLDKNFLTLILLSVTYAIFFSLNPKSGQQYIIIYAIIPWTLYLCGKYSVTKIGDNPLHLFYLLIITGILLSFSSFISVLTNILDVGFSEVDRNLPNFWTGATVSATIMGSYYVLIMCFPALLIAGKNKLNNILKTTLIILFIITVICSLRIGSRTQLGVFILCLVISLAYLIPKQTLRRNLAMLFFLILVIALTITQIDFDLDSDFLSAFAGRMQENGAGDIASGGGRTERWIKSAENIIKKPLGWDESEFGHAHNMWFDVLRIAGIIPFILLIIFTSNSFFDVLKSVRKNKSALAFNNQIIIYFFSFMMVFMVEPIFEGMFDLFAVFCFFVGVVNKYKTS